MYGLLMAFEYDTHLVLLFLQHVCCGSFDAVLQVNKFDDNGIYLQCESVFHSSKEDWENDRKNPEEVISIVTGLKLSIMMSA